MGTLPITISNYPKLSKPGLASVYGLEYDRLPTIYDKFVETRPSEYAYEQLVELIGTGIAPQKVQGGPMAFDSITQGVVTTAYNISYGLGLQFTFEEKKDNKYSQAVDRTKALANSMKQTREINAANLINNMSNASYAGGDGVALISASHPTANGVQSNLISGSLSEATLEDAQTNVWNQTDSRGIRINSISERLLIPNNLYYEARRILGSPLQSNTAENNMNVLRTDGLIGDIVRSPYFTSTTAWAVQTNVPNGLTLFENVANMFDEDRMSSTMVELYFAYQRYVLTFGDFRNIVGSTGA